MSGRSDSSSLFESDGVGYFRRRADGTYVGCDEAFSELLRSQPRALCAQVVEETRRSWCASYRRLLSGITVPKILFWFATRTPAYRQGWSSLSELFGEFPQLVNPAMVAEVRGYTERYVECVTGRGLPEPLIDRFTGAPTVVTDPWTSKPWGRNWYYPSAAMHEVSLALLEFCDFLRKIRRVHVDVDCSRNVACFKLLLGAHVEHDVLLVRPEFFKLGDIDVLEPLSLFLFRGGLRLVLGVRCARDRCDA